MGAPVTLSDASGRATPLTAATRHEQITPSDVPAGNFATPTAAIYCASDGTAQVVDADGTVLPYAMTAGQVLLVAAVRINSTDTTGTFYRWSY
jgi:hypothetical protein